MWRGRPEFSPRVRPNHWRLVSTEWRASETRSPTGTEEEEVVVAGVAGVPADKGGLAVVAAGKGVPQGPSGCTSSRWPSAPVPWPCTTPSPSGKTASPSTAPSSSSGRITWSGSMPRRSPSGHILCAAKVDVLCKHSFLYFIA